MRKAFGPKRKEGTSVGENCIMRSFRMCTPHQVLFASSNGR
jgi:hypothetical protein